MRRLIVLLLLPVLSLTACTFEFQTFPENAGEPIQTLTQAPLPTPAPTIEVPVPGEAFALEGPNIDYKGVRFTLDTALGSRLYVYDEEITIEGATAHHTRFALNPEEYCQSWCTIVSPVAEFEQAFGMFVFPPAGYRGGANVIFKAQEKNLTFQNGSGTRALETAGQDHFGVSNETLMYIFRGSSADKQYAVYVQIPIRAANLSETDPTTPGDIQGVEEYNQQTASTMNALTPGDFTPNLDMLDALVASISLGTP